METIGWQTTGLEIPVFRVFLPTLQAVSIPGPMSGTATLVLLGQLRQTSAEFARLFKPAQEPLPVYLGLSVSRNPLFSSGGAVGGSGGKQSSFIWR